MVRSTVQDMSFWFSTHKLANLTKRLRLIFTKNSKLEATDQKGSLTSKNKACITSSQWGLLAPLLHYLWPLPPQT